MKMILPNSLEEIQKWISSRIEHRKSFRICGKGTRFVDSVFNNSKFVSKEILSLQKFNATRFFDPEDMVLSIDSGMTYRNMTRILKKRKMFLPVNPWFQDSCIGSVLACNDFGPNRMNMGGIRDSILGIEYVNGNGEIVKAGGKVVKNVSGYNLMRMMIGSQGGLGVITSLTLKVIPLPTEPHAMYGIFKNQSWLTKVKEIHKCRIPLDWVQAVSTHDSNWILGMGYSGNEYTRARIEIEITKIFGDTLQILADGELLLGQKFTPGEKKFDGFLEFFRNSCDIDESGFHLFLTLTTEETLRFPIDQFLKENFKILIHPIGGDIHILHNSIQREEQMKYLEKIKSVLQRSEGKLKWVSGSKKNSQKDLGEFGVSNNFSLTKRIKNHLDPRGVFSSSYYD